MSLAILLKPETLILLQAVVIIGAFLFFLVSRNFTYGIYIWLLSILFFKYMRLDMANSVLPDLSIDRILFISLLGMFILQILVRNRRLLPFTGIEYSMGLFCFVAVVSMIWTGLIVKQGGRLQIGELLTGYIFPFSMFYISQNVYDDAAKRDGFIKFILLIGIYLGFTAVFEHFNIKGLIFPRYITDPYFGIHYGRARGPFAQAAVNGTVLGMVFLASFYFLFRPNKNLLWKICSFILLGLTPLAIFFTYTRATWVAAVVGLGVISIFTLRYKKNVFIVTALVLCVSVLSAMFFMLDYDTSSFAVKRATSENPVYDRLNLYIASINMFVHNPIFGVGFTRFSDNVMKYYKNIDGIPFRNAETHEHDTFMGILAEMGLVGLTLIMCVYSLILSRSIRLYRRFKENDLAAKSALVVFWGVMAVYVVNSVFIEMRYFEFVNSLFFIFAGIICSWERGYHEELV